MAQEGDECDFDALTAMLDNSDDEKTKKSSNVLPSTMDGDMSSDDDIDESELEQLAGLMEAEAADEDAAATKCASQEGLQQLQGKLGDDSEEEEAGQLEEKDGGLAEEVAGQQEKAFGDRAAEEKDDGENSEEEDTMEQLRLMQEQIMKLQSKLKNKKKKSPTTTADSPSCESSKNAMNKTAGKRPLPKIGSVWGLQDKSPRQKPKLSQELRHSSSPSVNKKDADRNVFNEMNLSGAKKHNFSPKHSRNSDKYSSPSVMKVKSHAETKVRHNSSASDGKKMLLISDDIFGHETPEEPKSVSRSSTTPKTKLPSSANKTGSPASRPKESPKLKKTSVSSQDDSVLPDNDSDWEGLDGELCAELSKSGNEIKKLMSRSQRDRIAHTSQSSTPAAKSDEKTRVAHTAKFDVSTLENRKPTWQSGSANKWEPKAAATAESAGRSSGGSSSVRPVDMNDASRCQFSGIRILNPLIPSEVLRSRMTDRKMIRMSRLHLRINTADMESDWVTMGVLVQKSEPKMSSKGSQYSIWTLSDLEEENSVKFFLFGDVHKQHWKTVVGSVIGLLNANVMRNSEKYQNSSQDVAITIETANKLLMMGRSKDLGVCRAKTKAGRNCSQFISKQHGEFCSFHVQTMYKKVSAKRPDLQSSHTGVAPRSFEKRLQAGSKGCVMYGGQSFTMGPQITTKKKANLASLKQHQKSGPASAASVRSTTLSLHQLLPEDEERLRNLKEEKLQEKNRVFHEMLSTPSVGSLNLVKHIVKKEVDDNGLSEAPSQKPSRVQSVTVSQVLSQMKTEFRQKRSQARVPPAPTLHRPSRDMDDLFHEGETVKPLFRSKEKAAAAKFKALNLIRNKGPIDKEDPNAVKKVKSPEHAEKIRKRLASGDGTDENTPEASSTEPPKKRSRLLGDLDLEDPEVQKLLKAKSRHDNQLTEKEQEKFDEYFDVREKTEKMEQKMATTKEIKCKAVSCKECKYTAYSALASCRQERHTLTTHDAVKRFFACKDCKKRVVTLDRYPKIDCKGCGGRAFEKTSMRAEKKVLLPNEQLLTRGTEEKYLNSLK